MTNCVCVCNWQSDGFSNLFAWFTRACGIWYTIRTSINTSIVLRYWLWNIECLNQDWHAERFYYLFLGEICGNHGQLALDRRSYVGLFSRILSRQLHQCLIMSMPLRHKEARIGWASCRVLVLSYERGLYYSIGHWDHNSTCWQEWSFVWSPGWHHFWW